MLGSGTVASATLLPFGGGSSSVSTHIDEYTGWMATVPQEINRYGSGGWPGIIVQLDADASNPADAIRDWADADDRHLVDVDEQGNRALVAAPIDYAAAGLASPSDALPGLDYVTGLAMDVQMTVPDPVGQLAEEGAFSAPEAPFHIPLDGAFDQSDVAYSGDVGQSTMADARAALNVDSVSATGSGVTVAVLDDGVDVASDSSVFGSRISAAKNFVSGETGVSNVGSASGHGTWVASAIAGNPSDSTYQGVAPGASLLVGKVLGESGGSSHDVAKAVRWADRNGADVINMSLGSHLYSPEVVGAIREVLENGSVTAVLVAAGNSRQTTRWVDSPASSATDISGALAVGATTVDPPADAQSVYFSSVGEHDGFTDRSAGATVDGTVEIAAPGAQIEALVPTSSGGTTTAAKSGTSMASPLDAGLAALALESTSFSPSEVEQRLSDTAQPVPAAGVTEVGWGMPLADNLIDGTQPEQSQKEARSDAAAARDAANQSLSKNTENLAPLRHIIDL